MTPGETDTMEITEVKVFPVNEEKLKAFVSVVFDRCFMVNDIKIINGREGLFISMPSRRKKNGEFKDVAHPLNNDTRQMLEDRILTEYELILEGKAEPVRRRSRQAQEKGAQAGKVEGVVAGSESGPAAESRGGREQQEEASNRLEEVEKAHLRDSFWTVS